MPGPAGVAAVAGIVRFAGFVIALLIRHRRLDRSEVDPGRALRRLAGRAALEHQQIDNHAGPGGGLHAALGQAHRAHEVCHAGDMFAGRCAGLVHRAGAGDEQRDAAGAQPRDRSADEVVVQPQPQGAGGGIGPHHAVGERRIPDARDRSVPDRVLRV